MMQEISVPGGNDVEIDVVMDDGTDLDGANVEWFVFAAVLGVPDITVPILIGKSTQGATITLAASPASSFTIALSAGDTTDMLGNYYHEALMSDAQGNRSTIVQGTFTVTQALLG